MIGLFILSKNDVLYFKYEDSLNSYFPKENKIDKNSIFEFFAPIVFLNLTYPDYSLKYIEIKDLKIVSEYKDENTFIIIKKCVNSLKILLQKFLQIFIKLVYFLFGPFYERLIEVNLEYFNRMISMLVTLIESEETLVFEASRSFNPSKQFSKKATTFLDKCVEPFSACKINICYAFLIDAFCIIQSKRLANTQIIDYFDEYLIFLLNQYFLDYNSNFMCKDVYMKGEFLTPSTCFFFNLKNNLTLLLISQDEEILSSALLKLYKESRKFKYQFPSLPDWKHFLRIFETAIASIPIKHLSIDCICTFKNKYSIVKHIGKNTNSYIFENHIIHLQNNISDIYNVLIYERKLPNWETLFSCVIEENMKIYYIGKCDEDIANKNNNQINMSDFPGLIYFAFVDRCTHKLNAPFITSKLSSPFTQSTISKQEIFSFFVAIQEEMLKGVTLIIKKIGDHSLVYQIYLLDNQNIKIEIEPSDFPESNIDFHIFYKDLKKKCVTRHGNDVKLVECWSVHASQLGSSVVFYQRDQLLSHYFPQKHSFLASILSFF